MARIWNTSDQRPLDFQRSGASSVEVGKRILEERFYFVVRRAVSRVI